jgi:hypothetical protein
VSDAKESVAYADRTRDAFQHLVRRTTHADALHQAGRRAEAEMLFREAEQMQAEREFGHPLLYSLRGFLYCDLLLSTHERTAWQIVLECGDFSPLSLNVTRCDESTEEKRGNKSPHSPALRAVIQRAAQMLTWEEGMRNAPVLDLALHHLTLARAGLFEAILRVSSSPLKAENSKRSAHIDAAVEGLRRSGNMDELPRGLITRAWLHFPKGGHNGVASAQEDLDEAWEIAERGPMRLYMADIHLYRARLFHAVKPYPWNKNPDGTERGPKDDLKDARKLIEKCGYWRRKEELEDAEEAAKNWK